jgi:gas vesicle protein
MRGRDLRNSTRSWARIAMKLGLLATDPRVWADVNERLSARMEDMGDAVKERYDEGVERLKDAHAALHGRNHWVAPTIGFLGGAALGAGVALLFAPRSGEETREALQDAAMDMKERVKDKVSSMTGTSSSIRSSAAS